MSGILVEYLDHCGCDESIANSARVSFGDFANWNEIPPDYTKERCDRLISYLGKHKHYSPFRQNSITIRCQAPIFIARQLMKHQAGLTWNEESRRYIDSPPTYFIPDEWRSRPDGSLKQGSGGIHTQTEGISSEYEEHLRSCHNLYDKLLIQGVAPEMARMVLPQSMMVRWVWTGNLLAFSHLYNLRSKSNAQQEVQIYAELLDEIISPLFPVAWESLKEGNI